MHPRPPALLDRLTLTQRFLLGSLAALLVGMAAVGLWVSSEIEQGVVQRTAATTALYVDSLIARPLQDLADGGTLSAEAADRLDWLLEDTPLGREVAAFQVWDRQGEIVYGTDPDAVGGRFPVEGELAEALAGGVAAHIGEPEGAAAGRGPLLEIYSPVRRGGSDEVVAAAEFYYAADDLEEAVAAALGRSWLVVGVAALGIYAVLAVFVRGASGTIDRQQRALAEQVDRLSDLLRQNEALHERVRTAAARTAALNERFLRRISAELHDGPAQDISLALLQLDHVQARCAAPAEGGADGETAREIERIQASLRQALQEVRAVSGGLLLPHLGELSVGETVERAVRGHRRRTRGDLRLDLRGVPPAAPLATKIALYRVVQESLANGWRHGGGAGQAVTLSGEQPGRLRLVVSDTGPGFDPSTLGASEAHLGLVGMRERVESLGGEFRIESAPGRGATVVATLPLEPDGEPNHADV